MSTYRDNQGPRPDDTPSNAPSGAHAGSHAGFDRTDAYGFRPPTEEQIKQLLETHPPTGPSALMAWMPMLLLGFAMLLSITLNSGPLALLAWFPLIGVFVFLGIRVRMYRALEAKAAYVRELAMMRRWPDALRYGWQLLPDLYVAPELHARNIAAMAYSLEQAQAHDAAIVALDYLIARMPAEHPSALQLRLQRTLAQLANDQLADADDTLRKLRGAPAIAEAKEPNPIRASYRMASLLQQVRTRHLEDAVDEAGDMLEELRPLGIDAGYAHALLALSFHQTNVKAETLGSMPVDEERLQGRSLLEHAATWWSRATLLLAPAALLHRYGDLRPLLDEPLIAAATNASIPPTSDGGDNGGDNGGGNETGLLEPVASTATDQEAAHTGSRGPDAAREIHMADGPGRPPEPPSEPSPNAPMAPPATSEQAAEPVAPAAPDLPTLPTVPAMDPQRDPPLDQGTADGENPDADRDANPSETRDPNQPPTA